MLPSGRTFYKMSGSGNDFIMVNAMTEAPGELAEAGRIQALCARGTGVGADGIVFLQPSTSADFRMVYLNSDGSRADLCGNASLCSTRLASELGIVGGNEFTIETDAGILADVEDVEDVGMRERRDGAHLGEELLARARIVRMRAGDQFDRDVPAEPRIAGAIHHAHPALAERRDDFIRA